MSRPKAEGPQTSITLRLPKDLHAAIVAKARGNERNVAQEIRHAIRLFLVRRDPDG